MSGTPYTMRKYRAWLEQRHGTIAALNAAWGTGFASFASIASQPTNPGDDPSDPLLLAGPVRHHHCPRTRAPGLSCPPHVPVAVSIAVSAPIHPLVRPALPAPVLCACPT